jgi:hypothetical protein
MRNKKLPDFTIYTLFILICLSILVFFIREKRIHYGGDIIEYYGMTQSLISHGGLDLTPEDQMELEERLGKGYLSNPEYYLITKDGTRRAVHFPLYSLFLTPIRVLIAAIGIDPFQVFRIGNLLLFLTTGLIFMVLFIKKTAIKAAFLALYLLSPLVWFIIWPGPELFSLTLILLGLGFYFQGNRPVGILLTSIASFQSQPLVTIPFFLTLGHLFEIRKRNFVRYLRESRFVVLSAMTVFIPACYYLMIFGSPFSHGKLEGVGLTNASTGKFLELLFDPNIGLFPYMPVLFILGFSALAIHLKEKTRDWWIIPLLISLIIFYLTNTNWNSGTAGYGPTRYALPLLPFLLYFTVRYLRINAITLTALIIYTIFQFQILSLNGYLMPTLENDKRLTPLSRFILDKTPKLYNPTPELFMERVQEKEGREWFRTTVYSANSVCRKAYIVDGDYLPLLSVCGFIPERDLLNVKNPPAEGFYITYP